MLRVHLAPARRLGLRIDADRSLQRRRPIDGEEHRLAERLLLIAPLIERADDLLRHPFLECKERIVLGDGFALFTRLVGHVLHRLHDGIPAAERVILQPQRMPFAHQFRHLRRHHRLDPGLHEFPVGIEVFFRDPLGGLEAPLILRRIAAHGADIVECPRLAAHHPLADRKVVVGRFGRPCLESRFIKTGRQHVDQVDVAGELGMLLLGDAAGNEDAEMADAFMHGVDDRLPVRPDLVDVGRRDRESSPAPAAAG